MSIKEYLNLPIDFKELTKGELLPRCTIQESIAQHLHLIITTSLGENKYNETFGCSIWEYEFNNTITDARLKDMVHDSLEYAIATQEKRLGSVEIKTTITQAELTNFEVTKRIKKRVNIEISAILKVTDEPFKYYEFFFLGPLSYY